MEQQPRTSHMAPTARAAGPEPERPATLHDRDSVPVDPGVRGTVLGGRYRIEDCIGSGAMGVVWTAWDRRLRRTVAVKQLSAAGGTDPAETRLARTRAMREGRIAARVVHPRAITVFDVVDHGGMPWLVMEYLPSRSLAAVLAEEGPLPPAEVARIGAQIADALSAVHEAGIVHGDVKPGNVLLTADGVAKITDFGVSRATWDTTATGSNTVAGTPGYFAPEVARGQDPTPASDVFSLGATLYAAVENELVCGRLDNTLAVLHAMAEGRLRPATRAGALGRPLAAVLRTDPARRPDIVSVRATLDRLGLAADPTSPVDAATAATTAPTATTAGTTAGSGAPAVASSWSRAAGGDAVGLPPTVGAGAPVAGASAPVGATGTGPSTATTRSAPRPGAARTRRPRGRRGAVVAAAVGLILAAGGGVGLAAVGDRTDAAPVAALPVPSVALPSTSPVPTSVEPPPAAAPLSPGATSTTTPPTTSAGSDAPVSPSDVRSTVVGYYSDLPDDVDGAWSVLSDEAQNASGGFGTYEGFWGGISSVSAGSVSVDGDTARTTLEFRTTDGRTTRESYTFRVGRSDDGKLIIESATRGSEAA